MIKLKTDIILVIHGLTQWNLDGRCQGHTDTELNEAGKKMSEALAKRLMEFPVSAIYSSDLRRAIQTVEPYAKMTGITIHKDIRIREGRWFNQERESEYEILPFHTEWETEKDVRKRMVEAMTEIALKHTGECVLVASHGGAVKEFVAYLSEQNNEYRHINLDKGIRTALNRFSFENGKWTIISLNDDSHLKEAGIESSTKNADY